MMDIDLKFLIFESLTFLLNEIISIFGIIDIYHDSIIFGIMNFFKD